MTLMGIYGGLAGKPRWWAVLGVSAICWGITLIIFAEEKGEVMASICQHGLSASSCPYCIAAQGIYSRTGLVTTGLSGVTTGQPFKGKIEERTEPITGWRGYSIDGKLNLSGVRMAWPSRKLVARCDPEAESDALMRRQQIKDILQDEELYQLWLKKQMKNPPEDICVRHLESATCTCGIWGRALLEDIHPDFPIIAHCQAYGVVATDNEGNFRASECEIDELWVVKKPGQDVYASMGNATGSALFQAYQYAPTTSVPFVPGTVTREPRPWYIDYIDWQRIADLLRDKYAVPVHVVETKSEISLLPKDDAITAIEDALDILEWGGGEVGR